jgi:hypothetical protein
MSERAVRASSSDTRAFMVTSRSPEQSPTRRRLTKNNAGDP